MSAAQRLFGNTHSMRTLPAEYCLEGRIGDIEVGELDSTQKVVSKNEVSILRYTDASCITPVLIFDAFMR